MGITASSLNCARPSSLEVPETDALAQLPKQEKVALQPALLREFYWEFDTFIDRLPSSKQQQFIKRIKRGFKEARNASALELDLSNLKITRLPNALRKYLVGMPVPVKTVVLSNNELPHLPDWIFDLKPSGNIRTEIVLAGVPLSKRSLDYINQQTRMPNYNGPTFSQLATLSKNPESIDSYYLEKEFDLIQFYFKRDRELSILNHPDYWILHSNFTNKYEGLGLNVTLPFYVPEELGQFSHLKSIAIYIEEQDNTSSDQENQFFSFLITAIKDLPDLEKISISGAKFNDFEKILKLKIKKLSFTECNVSNFLNKLKQIEAFDAMNLQTSSNTEESILPAVFNSLKKLKICSSEIECIPHNFNKLKNLAHLSLCHNNFQQFPHQVFSLNFLKKIHLYGNQLTFIPLEISQLKNLEELDLSSNRLTDIPVTIGNLPNLKKLSLSFNSELRTLPLTLFDLPSSCNIYLEGTGLSQHIIQEWTTRAASDPASPRLHFDQPGSTDQYKAFESLQAALVFWLDSTQINLVIDDQTIADWQKHPLVEKFITWLGRLRETQDFKNMTTRPALKRLITDLLVYIKQVNTPELITEIFTRAQESLGHCCDRVATGAKQVSLILLRNTVNNAAATSSKILECGITEYLSMMLEKIAGQRIMQLRAVDPIETYLTFEKYLGSLLKHLHTANDMRYEAMSHVQPIDLWRGLALFLAELQNPADLSAYLLANTTWGAYCEPIKNSPERLALEALRADYFVQEKRINKEKSQIQNPALLAQLEQQWQSFVKNFQVQEKALLSQPLSKAIASYVPLSVLDVIKAQQPLARTLDDLLKDNERKADKLLSDYQAKSDESLEYRRVHPDNDVNLSREFRELERNTKQALEAWQAVQDKMKPVRERYTAVWAPVAAALQALWLEKLLE